MMQALERNTINSAAEVLQANLPLQDAVFNGVSTDTRTLKAGNLFVALKGPHFDGHEYVQQAADKHAVAAVVSEQVDSPIPLLQVKDTRLALGELAKAKRNAFRGKVVGVTGSNGKTTVKEMLGAVLSRCGAVLTTQGNLNNDIGLPLTLLGLELADDYAVLEMGANHQGEIDYLTHIAQPDVAIITNAGAAHLKGFGSLEGVAKTKGEIYAGLQENGVAIVNYDDRYADYWLGLNQDHRVLCFSLLQTEADVYASEIHHARDGVVFDVHTPVGDAQIHLALLGEHNVRNALAVIAASVALDVPLDEIKLALEAFDAVEGRLKIKAGFNGCTLIDDTYNANPDSFKAAVDVLADFEGSRVLVMGDMFEVGDTSTEAHREVGSYAHVHGIEHLFAVGKEAKNAADSFGTGARFFDDQQALVDGLKPMLNAHTTLLIKGSRGAHMENIVKALVAEV